MCLTALKPESEISLADGRPSIRALQRWMKEAWESGKYMEKRTEVQLYTQKPDKGMTLRDIDISKGLS